MQGRHPSRVIAELAERQHGVVARTQLLELGITRDVIAGHLSHGLLYRMHSGVYAVGRRSVPRQGTWMAAVLAGGENAVLSHRSAAALWGIVRGDGGAIETTIPRSIRDTGPLRRHQAQLMPHEVTSRSRIPVTTPRRTIVDISGSLPITGIEAAVREAQYRHRIDAASLGRLLHEYRGRRGIARLRTALRNLGLGPRGRTRSPLEDRMASLLAATDIRQPDLNVLLDIGGELIEADCLWAEERVIIELDGGATHKTEAAFQADRERDRRLQALGWRVGRVTDEHMDEPERVLVDIRGMLNAGRRAGAGG